MVKTKQACVLGNWVLSSKCDSLGCIACVYGLTAVEVDIVL